MSARLTPSQFDLQTALRSACPDFVQVFCLERLAAKDLITARAVLGAMVQVRVSPSISSCLPSRRVDNMIALVLFFAGPVDTGHLAGRKQCAAPLRLYLTFICKRMLLTGRRWSA